ETTASWYSYIADSTEELRREIREMSQAGLTPMEFGLKVRSHPESLIVPARNKMRSSRMIPVHISLAGRLAETSVVDARDDISRPTMNSLQTTLAARSTNYKVQLTILGYYWQGASSVIVIRAMENYQNYPLSMRSYAVPLVNYLKKQPGVTCDVLL